jgi:hypothetical protein
MKEASVREFEISPNQYEPFRFWVERPATLNIVLFATAPVNLVLLNSEQKVEYERGESTTHPYTAAWPRKRDLEAAVKVDPGTWYLVVEGSTEPSRGRIQVAVNN